MYQVTFQTDKNFLSPEEISRHLHVSRRTVMRWIADGQLAALRIGNVTRIPVDAYQQFLSAHLIIGESSHGSGVAKAKRRKRTKRKQKRKSKKAETGTALAVISSPSVSPTLTRSQLMEPATESNGTYPSDAENEQTPPHLPPLSDPADNPQSESDNTAPSPKAA